MSTANLAGVLVGKTHPPRLMGVINVSPESFFKESVKTEKTLLRAIEAMERDGADILDIGAMSTAPYLKTQIPLDEEIKRLTRALRLIGKRTALPLSVDTTRAAAAAAARGEGASILNDITGLFGDPAMAREAVQFKGVILMAHPLNCPSVKIKKPIEAIHKGLQLSIKKAKAAGIEEKRLVIDPGIGFFREHGMPWWKWDVQVLTHLSSLKTLNVPVLAGVSRKSFIGELLGGVRAEERLAGSLAATAIALKNGARLIRTHDVKETKQFLKIRELFERISKGS